MLITQRWGKQKERSEVNRKAKAFQRKRVEKILKEQKN